MSVTVSRYFDLKFSHLDYRIHHITRTEVSDDTKNELCSELLASRACDIGIFLRHFRANFADREAMLSDLGMHALAMREKTKLFSTISSERGHARERRNLSAKTGPGKNLFAPPAPGLVVLHADSTYQRRRH